MLAPRRNLELKARCGDSNKVAALVAQLGARNAGLEVQTDTYFRAVRGRLKLREIERRPAVLIAYERPDSAAARMCNYHLVPVADPGALKNLLSDALGVRGVVAKHRHIWLWQNVRIHLDEVAGLGMFIEFEAVIGSEAEEAAAPAQLATLCRTLAITPSDHIAVSYADLLRI